MKKGINLNMNVLLSYRQAVFRSCIFCFCILITLSCKYRQKDCDKPFEYTFLDKVVSFPLSVDEAANRYKLVRTKYDVLFDNMTPDKATVSVNWVGSFGYSRYAPRTNIATQEYYNKDIYSINLHLRDSASTIRKVIGKLEKDFKGKFIKKKTRMDRVGTFTNLR